MIEAKWSGVLSTTEPRNDVGIIKVRQGNINSEIAEFQIVQNNKPYDLTGLTVYFCASFGLNLVEKPAVVVNTTGGKIQYTFDDDSMQVVGRQKGYFSIKKEESKIDSTQDFEFQVDSSLMTRSIDGKSYIYKLSTLIKVLDDFVKNGQNNFNVWFESVKEILYGVDPGGNILRELIEARKNSSGNIFASLKARLDKNEDDTAAQLAQTPKFANVKSFGAKGDGLTDDTEAIQAAVAYSESFTNRPIIYFPHGTYLISSFIYFNYTPIFGGDGMNSSIVKAISEMAYMFYQSTTNRFNGVKINDFQLDGNQLADIGLNFEKSDHSLSFNFKVKGTLKTSVLMSGWCNDFLECEISENHGDGVEFAGKDNNAINFINTKIFHNKGIGVILQNGNAIHFPGSTIENNEKCGIFVKGNVKNLDISDAYFEANGSVTGLIISGDLIKTDVLINGNLADPYSYGISDMNYQIRIVNNSHYNYAEDCYTIIAADGIEIDKNYMQWVGNLIRYIELNGVSKIDNLTVGYNFIESNPHYVNNEFSVKRNLGHRHPYHNWNLNKTIKMDMSKIALYPSAYPIGTATATIDAATPVKCFDKPTFKVTVTGYGNLNILGVTLNMEDYPELKGRNFFYEMNYKSSSLTIDPRMYIGGETATTNTFKPTSTGWQTESHGSVFPTSGEVTIGLYVQNVKPGDVIYMTYPEITVYNRKIEKIN